MNKKMLYIMCGPAGSGKSTWTRRNARPGVSAIISRDKVRFSMVSPEEDYFSKEDDVYAEFCRQIGQALESPWVEEVFADATHLTEKARKLLLNTVFPTADGIEAEDVEIIPVVVVPDLQVILEQNALREGRERVPDTVIRNMYRSFQKPDYDEKYRYADIMEV